MKTQPITPGALGPLAADAERTAAAARRWVHDGALPTRWAHRERFVLLHCGFGLGLAFLHAWQAWRQDAARSVRLVCIGLEAHPPTQADLARWHRDASAGADTDGDARARASLVQAWPPLTPNLHPIDFDGGRVRLLLAWGDPARLLPQLLASVDAFHLPQAIATTGGVADVSAVFKQLGRLAAPDALLHLAQPGAAGDPVLRAAARTAGFVDDAVPDRLSGDGWARHRPRHRLAALPGGLPAVGNPAGGLFTQAGPRDALVIGAGLAGSAAAWALAREGWQVRVLDRATAPAQGSSGNAVGLFHGAVHPEDGPHARLHRAAALRAARGFAPWIASGRVRGQIDGLLRLEGADADDGGPLRNAATGEAGEAHDGRALPFAVGHAEWLTLAEARRRVGAPVPVGGWWFGRGGWLVPGDLVRALLDDSGASFLGGQVVVRIERRERRWHALDADGRSLGHAAVMVLAQAAGIPALLEASSLGRTTAAGGLLGRMTAVRGQITGVPIVRAEITASDEATLPTRLPGRPVSGAGYVLPPHEGRLWCGATSQADAADPALRDADHRHNLAQLARLLGEPAWAGRSMAGLVGRVGWRAVTPDRLPWVGAVPDAAVLAQAARADRVRFVPRLRDADGGLHVLGAFGSRGITWALLCGELLASWVTGAPCPVEADLRDALDPARAWVARRRAQVGSDGVSSGSSNSSDS